MSKDNGGPAFPVEEKYCERTGGYTQYGSEGMTLRDYIAIHATDNDIHEYRVYKKVDRVTTNGTLRSVHTDNVLDVPASRYAYADAMLLERAK
jgi:hypothetical protein